MNCVLYCAETFHVKVFKTKSEHPRKYHKLVYAILKDSYDLICFRVCCAFLHDVLKLVKM